MSLPNHPFRPFLNALRAFGTQVGDAGLWAPFVLVALFESGTLIGLGRLDLVPSIVLAPILELVPRAEEFLHYRFVMERLPEVARALDLVLFLGIGSVLQGWAILRLARSWTGSAPPLFPGGRQNGGRLLTLVTLSGLLAVVPLVAMGFVQLLGEEGAARPVAIVAGIVTQMVLLAAPAFVVLHGLSLGQSVISSVALVSRLPIALPLSIVLLASLHVPGLLLRAPAIRAGAASHPDWILMALLGPIPAEIIGAVLAASFSAYFALRTRPRQSLPVSSSTVPARAGLLVLVLLLSAGCDSERSSQITLRYGCERVVVHAQLREQELLDSSNTNPAQWQEVASGFGDAVERLGLSRLEQPVSDPVERDLAKLTCHALLGRARASCRAKKTDMARDDYKTLLDRAVPYRGTRGRAALGLARCEDHAGRFPVALEAYGVWLEGIERGTWPLHRSDLEIPAYVSRRLRDRGQHEARAAWIDRAIRALQAAAERGSYPRMARYTTFVMLIGAERWDEAHAALRTFREQHDQGFANGALLLAEANLLAEGLGREREALGLLAGLHAEDAPFDSQHRVAGWLLAAQIQVRAGRLEEGRQSYEVVLTRARSAAGRSEALLGLARIDAEQGKLEEAQRHYTKLREIYPGTDAGLQAPLEEIDTVARLASREQALSMTPKVIQHYRSFIHQFGIGVSTMLAAQYGAESMGRAGDWEGGVAFLDSIADSFGRDPRAGTLLVRAAELAVYKLEDSERAGHLLVRLHARYPQSDVAVLASGLADSLGLEGLPSPAP